MMQPAYQPEPNIQKTPQTRYQPTKEFLHAPQAKNQGGKKIPTISPDFPQKHPENTQKQAIA
jgi:hypothetical protein